MKFHFHNPTEVYFGSGEFNRAGKLAAGLGSKCLLVTGQGSVERHGYLDRLKEMLETAGVEHVHFPGIEPNPHLETCQDAARFAINADCDSIVGLGGGSVMDACKAIAVGFHDPDGLWDYINHGEGRATPVEQALPIMVISTLAATGSEMDSGGVITLAATNEKCVLSSPMLFPKIALVDENNRLILSGKFNREQVNRLISSFITIGTRSTISSRCSINAISSCRSLRPFWPLSTICTRLTSSSLE